LRVPLSIRPKSDSLGLNGTLFYDWTRENSVPADVHVILIPGSFYFQRELPAGERPVPIIQTGLPAAVKVAAESPAPAQATSTTSSAPSAHETNIKIEREA